MTPDLTRTAGDGTHTADHPTSDTRPAGGGVTAPLPDAPPGFAIEREIGRGATGVVYLARQVGLNRLVALKLVQAGDAGSHLRFLAEAEAMAAVRHPHVAEVYQFGEHAGRPYLALEYCPGGDLTATFRAGHLPPPAAAELLAAVADGVAAAHAAGIVHRDLKPHNVLLTADGTPKVTDFGLAKRDGGSDLTKTNAVMGTPAYMPPEQAKGETKFAGPPADVWALGVMLYEALTGTRPFGGADHWAVLAAVQRGTFPMPRAVVRDIPRELELVCLKCLKPEPHERYPTAAELAADLRNWLAGKPIAARPAGVVEQAVKWAKRNRKLAGMGLAVLLTMATATAVSVGFGLDANEQRKTAEGAVKTANEEKEAAVTARNDLARANERTERAMAKALLGPIADGDPRLALGEPELNTFRQLAGRRTEPAGLMFLEEATATDPASRRLSCRADFLFHAVIGLDANRRREVDELLTRRLRDPAAPDSLKLSLTWAATSSGFFGDYCPDAVDALLTAVRKNTKLLPPPTTSGQPSQVPVDNRNYPAVALAAMAPHVPPDRWEDASRTVADALVDALREGVRADWHRHMEGLRAVTERMPADRQFEVLNAVLHPATPSLYFPPAWLPERWKAAAERLPADRVADACGRMAELLLAELGTTPNEVQREMATAGRIVLVAARLPVERGIEVITAALDKSGGGPRGILAKGLGELCERLPADKAAELCAREAGVLVAVFGRTVDARQINVLDQGLVAVAKWMPPDEAAGVLLAAMGKCTGWVACHTIGIALAEVCRRLPADKAAEVGGRAADILVALWGRTATQQEATWPYLSFVCQELPAGNGAAALLATLTTTPKPTVQGGLAGKLARVAERLPEGEAAEVCNKAAGVMMTALGRRVFGEEVTALAKGLTAVCKRLPPGKGAEILSAAMVKVREERHSGAGEFAEGLAAVAERLPADERARVCGRAADQLVGTILGDFFADEQGTLTGGLSAVCGGLPPDTAADVLLTTYGKAKNETMRWWLAKRLAAEGQRLPPGKAAGLLRVLERAAHPSDCFWLAKGLAAAAERMPADAAAEVCGQASDALVAALPKRSEAWEQRDLSGGLFWLMHHLSKEKGGTVRLAACESLVAALSRADGVGRKEVAWQLQQWAVGMPGDRGEELCGVAADALLTAYGETGHPDSVSGLASCVVRLPEPDRVRLKRPEALAALAGGVVLHPEAVPKPRPLPPQTLVDLLKHPFCVKEARRAVLDALEVTYDRTFADLWEFVAFAEQDHPELDLLTPPKRPQK